MRHRVLVDVAIGLIFAVSASIANAVAVAVKPGLWEWSSTSTTSETRTTIPELGKMPKEDRAKAEADMRRPVLAPPQTTKTRKCVSSATVRDWIEFTGAGKDYAACVRKPLSQSAKSFKMALTCGDGKATGTLQYSASGDTIVGKSVIVRHESMYERTETVDVVATRVGGDCGELAVPPNLAPKK